MFLFSTDFTECWYQSWNMSEIFTAVCVILKEKGNERVSKSRIISFSSIKCPLKPAWNDSLISPFILFCPLFITWYSPREQNALFFCFILLLPFYICTVRPITYDFNEAGMGNELLIIFFKSVFTGYDIRTMAVIGDDEYKLTITLTNHSHQELLLTTPWPMTVTESV